MTGGEGGGLEFYGFGWVDCYLRIGGRVEPPLTLLSHPGPGRVTAPWQAAADGKSFRQPFGKQYCGGGQSLLNDPTYLFNDPRSYARDRHSKGRWLRRGCRLNLLADKSGPA